MARYLGIGALQVRRQLGVRIVMGALLILFLVCLILSTVIQSERALGLPGGLSTFMSENLIGCLVGLLLHMPVVILTSCLMLSSFLSKESKMFGQHRFLTVNVTTWIRILGVIGFLGCIFGPANLHFLTCTFLNPLWYLYLLVYAFCIIAGSGGFKLSLTEDIEVSLPSRRPKPGSRRRRKSTLSKFKKGHALAKSRRANKSKATKTGSSPKLDVPKSKKSSPELTKITVKTESSRRTTFTKPWESRNSNPEATKVTVKTDTKSKPSKPKPKGEDLV